MSGVYNRFTTTAIYICPVSSACLLDLMNFHDPGNSIFYILIDLINYLHKGLKVSILLGSVHKSMHLLLLTSVA